MHSSICCLFWVWLSDNKVLEFLNLTAFPVPFVTTKSCQLLSPMASRVTSLSPSLLSFFFFIFPVVDHLLNYSLLSLCLICSSSHSKASKCFFIQPPLSSSVSSWPQFLCCLSVCQLQAERETLQNKYSKQRHHRFLFEMLSPKMIDCHLFCFLFFLSQNKRGVIRKYM